MHPYDHNILFAGTYNGVVKSVDQGRTWEMKSSGMPSEQWPYTIAIDDDDADIMYASTKNGQNNGFCDRNDFCGVVMKSTDGGENWYRIMSGLHERSEFYTLLIYPLNHNILFLSTSRGVYLSQNAGESWEPINSGLPSTHNQVRDNIANNLANPSFIWVGQRLVIPGCSAGDTPSPAPPAPTPTPQPGVTPSPTVAPGPVARMDTPEYGVHTFLWWSGEYRARDAQLVKDAGLTWVKELFPWRSIEGAGKGIFDWSVADQVVQVLNDRGLKIIARVDFQPAWARADGANNVPPDNYRDYGDFVYAMASRYKGRIQAYEIWNEPNLAREWGDRPPNAAEYVALLRVAYRRIKEADPNATVITAGLAPTGTGLPHAIPDAQYLREMYQAGVKNYFDVLGVHAPGYKAAPETSPDEVQNN